MKNERLHIQYNTFKKFLPHFLTGNLVMPPAQATGFMTLKIWGQDEKHLKDFASSIRIQYAEITVGVVVVVVVVMVVVVVLASVSVVLASVSVSVMVVVWR